MVLGRATGNNEPENGDDSGVEPQMMSVGRAVSMAGLLERIETEFNAETAGRLDLLDTDEAQREMVRDVVDYVLATEAIKLSRAERLGILDAVYDDLFHAGPLEAVIDDPDVTEIKITGTQRIYTRQGAGDMREVEARFTDAAQLERFIQRKGAYLTPADPFLEVGARFGDRPARLTVTGAPISTDLHVDIRLHPAKLRSLDDLVAQNFLNASSAALLRAILAGGHGLMIVGDVGTGKTTLLQALLPNLPDATTSVERAAELRLSPTMQSLRVVPPLPGQAGVEFAAQIVKALENRPPWLLIDELRFDESTAMWSALTEANGPRCLWLFRGAVEPLRLKTAFSMAVRRAVQGIAQEAIHSALMDKLPFVAVVARQDRKLRLLRVSEWQFETPDAKDLSQIALRQLWPPVGMTAVRSIAWSD